VLHQGYKCFDPVLIANCEKRLGKAAFGENQNLYIERTHLFFNAPIVKLEFHTYLIESIKIDLSTGTTADFNLFQMHDLLFLFTPSLDQMFLLNKVRVRHKSLTALNKIFQSYWIQGEWLFGYKQGHFYIQILKSKILLYFLSKEISPKFRFFKYRFLKSSC